MTILLPERRQDRSISFLPRQPVRRVAKRQTHPKKQRAAAAFRPAGRMPVSPTPELRTRTRRGAWLTFH